MAMGRPGTKTVRQGRPASKGTRYIEPLLWVVLAGLVLSGCAPAPKKADTENLVWPAPPEEPRIRYVAEYRNQKSLKDNAGLRERLLGDEKAKGELVKPYGVAVGPERRRIYVADSGQGSVFIFDLEEKRFHRFETDAQGGLALPIEVRVDSQERVYVTDSSRQRVKVFSPSGETLMALGKTEALERPTGLAVDEARDRLYVTDTKEHRIVVYDLEGNFLREMGGRGKAPGQFNLPVNLAVNDAGDLHVVDAGNFRVQVFDAQGDFLRMFGQAGDAFGSMTRPKGIGLDSEGHIYLVDAGFNNVQVFDEEGRILMFFGRLGQRPGEFWLPAGLFVDDNDRIYVVDSVNQRVQVFEYLGAPTEERTPLAQ